MALFGNIPFTYYLLLLPGAFFAPIIHEFVKARVSAALGDVTIQKQGLMTFNPKKFFEPIGFFFMMYFNLGWGQPVQISPLYFKDRKMGVVLTYLVPIVTSIFIGILVLFIWGLIRFDLAAWATNQAIAGYGTWQSSLIRNINTGVILFAQCNIGLAIFNFLPVNPLAGSKLLPLILSPDASIRMSYYEKPLQVVMIIMLMFGFLQMLVFPIRDAIMAMAGF